MKNLYIIGALILVFAGGVYVFAASPKEEVAMQNTQMAGAGDVMKNDAMKEATSTMMASTTDGMMKGDASDTMMVSGDTMAAAKENTMMKGDAMMSAAGTYEAYSPEKLALASKGKVVIFFHATWCPTCHALDADITAHLSKIPEGVHILKLDYDTATALRKQYGITVQHTFVQVDSTGKLIQKWSDSSTLAEVVAHLK